ncbi:MAG: TraR/DksA family transcriptional regulator [Planctomycetaceae bacterium]|nr:TraR/DksA family transcriptional regulator [Planctomycetaceae bacterium]
MSQQLTLQEIKNYRAVLVAMLSKLSSRVTELADKALSPNSGELSTVPLHLADAGTDNFDQAFSLSLAETGSQTLPLIEEAIGRIDEGTFGICEECGVNIPRARLKAIPFAHLCVKCASVLEQNRY